MSDPFPIRAYAAIHLKVPNSGIAEVDAMIQKALEVGSPAPLPANISTFHYAGFVGYFPHQVFERSNQEWKDLAFKGNKIEAIKIYRTLYGADLKTAKDAVERFASSSIPTF